MFLQPPNAFSSTCPTRALLDRLADKWTTLVIIALMEQDSTPKRFSSLLRRIDGISQKMLTQTLRSLERDGLVTRKIYAEVPLRVEYQLTALGQSLSGPIIAIRDWAESHMGDVLAAQTSYDEREDANEVTA